MNARLREFVNGTRLLGSACRILMRRPRLFLLGAVPPLVTSIVFLVLLIALLTQVEEIIGWFTPFADQWSAYPALALRVVLGIGFVAAAVLVMVVSFSSITLTFGFSLYDKIAEAVERELGATPLPSDEPGLRAVSRSVRQSLVLIIVSIVVTFGLFLAGFIPVVGQVVVPIVSAVFGGWMLCIELVGSAFERRGLVRLADRRAAMRQHRARVLGFSIPTFLLLAVPFSAVIVFPIATAAGTILAHDLLPTPTRDEHIPQS